jgi:hypothetical protein
MRMEGRDENALKRSPKEDSSGSVGGVKRVRQGPTGEEIQAPHSLVSVVSSLKVMILVTARCVSFVLAAGAKVFLGQRGSNFFVVGEIFSKELGQRTSFAKSL